MIGNRAWTLARPQEVFDARFRVPGTRELLTSSQGGYVQIPRNGATFPGDTPGHAGRFE